MSTETTTAARLPMWLWLASEDGRRCPSCGRFIGKDDLMDMSGTACGVHLLAAWCRRCAPAEGTEAAA